MSSTLADLGLTWADVLRMWSELDVPEGWRPDISPKGIFMTPPPSGSHNLIAAAIHRALVGGVEENLGVFQTLAVAIPAIGGVFMPDLCVVARTEVPEGDPVGSEHALLAVEVTSRNNAHHDRERKKWAYAHGLIAQYLLVDAFDENGPTISLFSRPAGGIYQDCVSTSFGQKITLAAPLAVVIDTALFPR